MDQAAAAACVWAARRTPSWVDPTRRRKLPTGVIGRQWPGPRSSCPATKTGTQSGVLLCSGRHAGHGSSYITELVNLLGPVRQVLGMTARTREQRTATTALSRGCNQQDLAVCVRAVINIAMSFDVPQHRHADQALRNGATLLVPDRTASVVRSRSGGTRTNLPVEHAYADGNYRIIGVADLAHAIRSGRAHRASGELAYHVLEVMEAFEVSSERGGHVVIDSRPERPAMVPTDVPRGELD